MEKILVLRGGALGDFIVTLPALALLRERWPRARIELAGNVTAGELAVARGVIDVVHSQHAARWAGMFGDAPLPADFAVWLATFDLVLSYWPDPEGELRRRFPLHARQRFLSAPAMPTCAPAAAHYCAPLRELGIEERGYLFRMVPLAHARSDEREQVMRPLASEPRVAIHPGSGSPRKNWPAENWLTLIEKLPALVALILGEAEIEKWRPLSSTGFQDQRVHSSQPDGNIGLHLVNLPLEELVVYLSRCRLFLGHDSGISHLAAACGAKCLLLFGPTEPALWAPPAPNVQVIRRVPDLAALPVHDVRRAVEEALSDQT